MKLKLLSITLITLALWGCGTTPNRNNRSNSTRTPPPYAAYSRNVTQEYVRFSNRFVLPKKACEEGIVDPFNATSILNFWMGGGAVAYQTATGAYPVDAFAGAKGGGITLGVNGGTVIVPSSAFAR